MKPVIVYEVTTMVPNSGITQLHMATIRQDDAEVHARGIHRESKQTVIPDIWETPRTPVAHPRSSTLGTRKATTMETKLMKDANAIRLAKAKVDNDDYSHPAGR